MDAQKIKRFFYDRQLKCCRVVLHIKLNKMFVILVSIYPSACIKYLMEELLSKKSHFGDMTVKQIFEITILLRI